MVPTNAIRPLAVGLEEASAMLAVAPRTLRKWATDRRVKSVKLGSRLVFRISDLERLLEDGLRTKEERPAENGPQKGFLTHATPQ
jgi:excisionase family DNA binding protein